MDLYIYYRVAAGQRQELQERVTRMQTELAEKYAISTALKRRPEEENQQHTWMEVYCDIPEGFGAILESAITQMEVAPLIEGERHTEYFLDISACA